MQHPFKPFISERSSRIIDEKRKSSTRYSPVVIEAEDQHNLNRVKIPEVRFFDENLYTSNDVNEVSARR
jgi:hypothetical protein